MPFGRPGKPFRLMVGLLILKQLENLSESALSRLGSRTRISRPSAASSGSPGS
ncbi:MAG TPA: hypothetical protein DGF30_08065 [Desulfomicrobium sp.]|nr:hypothetical protein [Desulfomicrobium sp.]